MDRLNTSYLVFCADIDAVEEDGQPLPKTLTPTQQRRVRDSYARKLWETMGEELDEIYRNCVGFENVKTADDFAVYLDKCHVETTMPFHDYYLEMPEFNHLPLKWVLAAVGIPLIFSLAALVLRLFGVMTMPGPGTDTFATFIFGTALTALIAFATVKYVNSNGAKPLAPGKYDDLPSVLKALYVQQRFADFAVDAQGLSAQDLHAQFGDFIAKHKPSDREGPTQAPGVVRSKSV